MQNPGYGSRVANKSKGSTVKPCSLLTFFVSTVERSFPKWYVVANLVWPGKPPLDCTSTVEASDFWMTENQTQYQCWILSMQQHSLSILFLFVDRMPDEAICTRSTIPSCHEKT